VEIRIAMQIGGLRLLFEGGNRVKKIE
jgi:hypothetical protein